jgi:DNA modification methylase
MIGFEKIIGHNDMMAYLTMMTIRLIELHRILKDTGSLYLHCDPTASHYLKVVLDVIFGKHNFRNEIIWKRTFSHSDAKQGAKHYGRLHDTILFYTKSDNYTFNTQHTPHSEQYIKDFYKHEDSRGKYQLISMLGPGGAAKGNPYYEVMGIKRYWAFSKETMQDFINKGLVVQTKPGNVPRLKRYLKDFKGVPLQSIWVTIPPVQGGSKEKMGYQTQKPEKLLEWIISSSSNEDDWVLDPFCGCGTTIAVAEKLNRKWVGIDVTALAINLVKHRLNNQFADRFREGKIKIEIDGLPKDLHGANALFEKDPFEFQYWVLDMLNAMPTRGKSEDKKKGADEGIDGVIVFKDIDQKHTVIYKKLIVSVKGGKHISVKDIRDLKGVIEREKAEGGILVSLHEPTEPMIKEANISGFFKNRFMNKDFQKVQIITVEQLLVGRKPELPSGRQEITYYKEAPKTKVKGKHKQVTLFEKISISDSASEGRTHR